MRIFIFSTLLLVTNTTIADTITYFSCHNKYKVISKNDNATFINGPKKNKIIIKHKIENIKFNPDSSIFAIYGQPKKINPRSPQVTYISLYTTKNPSIPFITTTIGTGILGLSFNKSSIAIEEQTGIYLFNYTTKKYSEGHEGDLIKKPCANK